MASTAPQPLQSSNPFGSSFDNDTREVEEWEDWEDEEVETPATAATRTRRSRQPRAPSGQVLIDFSDNSPITSAGPTLTLTSPGATAPQQASSAPSPVPVARHQSVANRPVRLKSRARQKAQNARAGIRLVTDMTKLRAYGHNPQGQQQQQQNVAHQLKPATSATHEERQGKFVDAAALRALEGEPNSASVGSWAWLRRKPTANKGGTRGKGKGKARQTLSPTSPEVQRQHQQQDLSPADRPIVIGIAVPESDRANHAVSPQTAVLETPLEGFGRYLPVAAATTAKATAVSPLTPVQKSVWSPETPSSDGSPFRTSSRIASSVYSQMTGVGAGANATVSPVSACSDAPPVPALPSGYAAGKGRVQSLRRDFSPVTDLYSATDDSPHTEFEEDGSPRSPLKRVRSSSIGRLVAMGTGMSSSKTQSAWWEQVTTPSVEQSSSSLNPFVPNQMARVPEEPMPASTSTAATSAVPDNWWVGKNEKKGFAPTSLGRDETGTSSVTTASRVVVGGVKLSPQPTGSAFASASASSSSSSSRHPSPQRVETHSDKARILVEENARIPTEEPPPYSPPSNKHKHMVAYSAILPSQRTGSEAVVSLGPILPSQRTGSEAVVSPGPISPAFQRALAGPGAISMSEIPLTPAAAVTRNSLHSGLVDLPDRPAGTFVTGDHFVNVSAGPMHRVERKRRRHEKEEAVARRIGGFWRGRGCIPEGGCYGRSGREGRKRRRICLAICGIVLAGLIVMIVLIVVLTRRAPAPEALEENIWLNLTNFPPIPTGVLTVAGTDNTQAVTGCVQPPTMWSCALPKEQHQAARAAGLPYAPNQPSLIFQIQFDNNTRQLWNFVGEPPHPAPVPPARPIPTVTSRAALTQVAPGLATLLPRSGDGEKDAGLEKRQQQQFDPGFVPTPPPPSFQEIWFLGNTTDGIVSDIKAGEPTPFYISLLADVNSTVGPNVLSRRQATPSPQPSPLNTSAPNLTPSVNLSSLLPPEELNPDGTGAPARFMPRPLAQQPLRLYDRGLPTEHYGFYAYFNRTIYLRSVTPLVNPLNPEAPPLDPVPADLDGGAPQTEARFVVTWAETRFKVSIWTRMSNTTRLLGNGTRPGRDGTTLFAQPGTMPYPVTITTDQHGGNPARKRVYHFSVDERQRIHRGDAKLIENNLAFGGTLVNNKVGGDPTQGGFDGGTGGCKCEWVNFKVVRPVGGSGGQG